MSDEALNALAARAGLFERYFDLQAVEHVASDETKRALLAAMGLDVGDADGTLGDLDAERDARALPPAIVVRANHAVRLTVPHGSPAWHLIPDPRTGQAALEGRSVDGSIDLPALPVGLHEMVVRDRPTLLVAAPQTAPDLAAVGLAAPRWGVTTALYGLRSQESFGIGTYRDLAAAAEAMAPQGADFIGINPVHALGAASSAISPYSPSHRGFLNTDPIAPVGPIGNGDLAALRSDAMVDYAASRLALHAHLRAAYGRLDAAGREALEAFRRQAGNPLQDFATFEALSLVHGADWRRWPQDLGHPTAPAVRRFAADHVNEIGYHAYLQFLADDQLADAQRRSLDAGMALGVYGDLAIGVRADGAEIWAEPGAFARGVSLGTPPDQFNATGQVWGLAPMSPLGLERALYRPFVDTVRAVFRYSGIARIDHVLGFMRCFWVPEDGSPGGYVRYPTDVLLAITKVEATHAGCLVIGEDLGVLPEGLRERLAEARLYGCAVAQFERGEDGDLRHPSEYRPETLASFATHDTPTVRGFWRGWEIDRQREFGQIDTAAADAAHLRRDWDRRRLTWLTQGTSDEPAGDADVDRVAGLHALLGEAASDLVAIQIDDLFARLEQPNFPGTVDEYPNWRLKCPVTVAELRHVPALESVRRVVESRHSGELRDVRRGEDA